MKVQQCGVIERFIIIGCFFVLQQRIKTGVYNYDFQLLRRDCVVKCVCFFKGRFRMIFIEIG